MEEVVHALHGWVGAAGPWLAPIVGLCCFLKYVFPPVPSDSVLIIGATLSHGDNGSAWSLFAACMAGSVAGMVVDYQFGRWLVGRTARRAPGERVRWLPQAGLDRLESGYRRWGAWLLVLHRVLPVARALVFVFAGMSRLGAGRTLLLGSFSTAAGHAGLIWATATVSRHLPTLSLGEGRTYGWIGVAMVLTAVVGIGLRAVARRRQGRATRTETDPEAG
jgi:membrane protein DedA with SNARE-associated domain